MGRGYSFLDILLFFLSLSRIRGGNPLRVAARIFVDLFLTRARFFLSVHSSRFRREIVRYLWTIVPLLVPFAISSSRVSATGINPPLVEPMDGIPFKKGNEKIDDSKENFIPEGNRISASRKKRGSPFKPSATDFRLFQAFLARDDDEARLKG